jgi:hemoglobin
MQQSLFNKYGGFAKISKVVLELYDRLLDDDDVGPFFDDVDMARVVDHQTKFVSALLGGPASFTDDQIRRVHADIEISDRHFETLKAILSGTLTDFGLEPDDVLTVLDAFEERRRLVVSGSDVD